MEAYANALLFAIPIFMLLVLAEIIYGHFKGMQTYTFMDTISSLSSGLTNIIKVAKEINTDIENVSWREIEDELKSIESSKLNLTDKRDEILWSSYYSGSNSDGSIPFSPVSLITGIFQVALNDKNETALQVVDMVTRKIIVSLPEKEIILKNNEINLISKSTESSIKSRHIADSMQTIDFINKNDIRTCTDLGSGAGLPGIVLGIIMSSKKPTFKVIFYEKSYHKSNFLREMSKKFKLDVDLGSCAYILPCSANHNGHCSCDALYPSR